MKKFLVLLVILMFLTLGGITSSNVLAQEAAPPQAAPAEPVKKEAQEEPKAASSSCKCLEPATSAINKAYASVEEDEWNVAIKTCKNSVDAIKELAKTCKCPEVAIYQSIAEAFLKYSEGGNHLDTVDEPDCPYATKLYSEAIRALADVIPKIQDQGVKTKASDVKEYAEEEQEFVKDECITAEEKPTEKTGG